MFSKKICAADYGGVLADRVRAIGAKPINDDDAPELCVATPADTHAARQPRLAIYKAGVLYLDRGIRVQVVVRNISQGGARVEFSRYLELPAKVTLALDGDPRRAPARVAWQSEGAAGLKFE